MEATAITGGAGESDYRRGVAKIMGEELTSEKNNNSAQTDQSQDSFKSDKSDETRKVEPTTSLPVATPTLEPTITTTTTQLKPTTTTPLKPIIEPPPVPLTLTEIDIFLKLINIPQGYIFDKIKNIPGKGFLVILIILIYILIIYFCSFFWIANKENRNVVAMESKMFRNLVYNRSGDDVIKNIKTDAFQNMATDVEPMTNRNENTIQTKLNSLFSFGKKKVGDFIQYSEKKIEVGIEGFIEWIRRVMVQSAIREQKIKTTRRL